MAIFFTMSTLTFVYVDVGLVQGYHSMNLSEFSPYIAKTNLMYRCQFCLQEVYHEKSVIMNHLAFHNLDIDSYAHIYERPRPMYHNHNNL